MNYNQGKLGVYVHWKYSAYKKYGLTIDGSGGTSYSMTGSQLLHTMRQAVRKNIPVVSNGAVQQFEKQLNYFYGGTYNNKAGLTQQQREQIVQALLRILENEGKSLAGLGIDASNLSAVKVKSAKNAGQTKMGNIGQGSSTTVEAVIRRIEELEKRFQWLQNESIADQHLAKKISDFLQLYQNSQIPQSLNQALSNSITKKLMQQAGVTVTTTGYLGKEWLNANKSFIDDLNELIRETALVNDAMIMGAIAEYVPLILPNVYEKGLQRGTDEIIKEFTKAIEKGGVGNQRSAKVLLENRVYGVSEGGKSTAASRWQKLGVHGSQAYINYTQDKVDINAKLIGDNQILKASVKNYAMGAKTIHLLSGSSLVKYLQIYPQLGNHYLNITANIGRQPWECAPSIDVQYAHQAMLVALGAHALAGGLFGAKKNSAIQKLDAAEVLVVNWRNGNRTKFKVYPIYKIIQNIEQYLDFRGGADLSKPVEWHNTYIGNFSEKDPRLAYARSINLINELHKQQLSVSLRVSKLKQI